ncbi:MAG: CtsR family transcriptional regulator [Clostridia bacterium]|nr:CtsR family transcriptional regulator [Clostridia bacterium]
MANISDIIEKFLLDALKQDETMDISRNELASFFNCAPSQINYVLSTRFTTERGFEVISQRGGSGYVRLIKLNFAEDDYLQELITHRLKEPIDYNTTKRIIANLLDNEIINEREQSIILSSISPKALACPISIEDKLRSQILKNILITLISREHL